MVVDSVQVQLLANWVKGGSGGGGSGGGTGGNGDGTEDTGENGDQEDNQTNEQNKPEILPLGLGNWEKPEALFSNFIGYGIVSSNPVLLFLYSFLGIFNLV